MTTGELITAITTAIATDETIEAWCDENFGSVVNVLVGVDENNPPTPASYPLVAILELEHTRSHAEREQTWTIMMGIGIVSDSITTDDNVVTRDGVLLVERLRELVETCLYRAGITPNGGSGSSFIECYHPLYISTLTMIFRRLTTRSGLTG